MKHLSDWVRSKNLKLRTKIYDKRVNAQLNCKHDEIVEGKLVPSSWICYSSPPFRVCKHCGFSEHGWSCGYQILKGDAEKITRDAAFQFSVGKIHPNGNFVRVGDIWDKNILYKMAVEKLA